MNVTDLFTSVPRSERSRLIRRPWGRADAIREKSNREALENLKQRFLEQNYTPSVASLARAAKRLQAKHSGRVTTNENIVRDQQGSRVTDLPTLRRAKNAARKIAGAK